jgi:prefoldin subunit 5
LGEQVPEVDGNTVAQHSNIQPYRSEEALAIDLSAMMSPFAALNWARQAAEATGRRVASLIKLIDRADAALDDVVELRRSIQFIADNIAELTESAAGINRNAGEIAAEIVTLSQAAQGIDTHAERLATEAASIARALPTVQRIAEIVDPLENTVVRLGRVVDRIPGGKRKVISG